MNRLRDVVHMLASDSNVLGFAVAVFWFLSMLWHSLTGDVLDAKLDLIIGLLFLLSASSPGSKIEVDARHHITVNQYLDEDQFIVHSLESWYGIHGDAIPEKFRFRDGEAPGGDQP